MELPPDHDNIAQLEEDVKEERYCHICEVKGSHTTQHCDLNPNGKRPNKKKIAEKAKIKTGTTDQNPPQNGTTKTKKGDGKKGGKDKSKIECQFHKQGKCEKGKDCPYKHTEAAAVEDGAAEEADK